MDAFIADEDTSPCAWHAACILCTCSALTVLVKCSHVITFVGRYALYIVLVSLLFVCVIPVYLLNPLSVDNSEWAADLLLRHVTKLVGISWTLRGKQFLGVQRGGVIIANHQSILDVLGMFQIWSTMGRCSVVARKELFYIWPFGLAAWLGGVVFIDRKRPDSAKRQLEITSKLMGAEKTKLWMFAEGTRNSSKKLLPFKKGAFRLAIDCQVPILPVVYSPYYFIDYDKQTFSKGKMIIKSLEPIETVGLTADDVNELTERTRKLMQDAYDELNAEVLAGQNLVESNIFEKM